MKRLPGAGCWEDGESGGSTLEVTPKFHGVTLTPVAFPGCFSVV